MIGLIESALIHGQSQPWMYEVLALSMEIVGRPKEEIERVVLSLTDFGQVDYQTMMYSGAYLSRFDRYEPALKLFRQASALLPERAESYLLGLKLAQKSGNVDDLQWAVCGILNHAWGMEYVQEHRQAEDAALEMIRQLKKGGKVERAGELEQAVAEAKLIDLDVRVEWSGAADLDLGVEEPAGSLCSFEARETIAGGRLLHDGCGPAPANCYEHYVCPQAVQGEYRIHVKQSWGESVGNRAVVTIVAHRGATGEIKTSETVILEGKEAIVRFRLDAGRRTQPRILGMGLGSSDLLEVLEEICHAQVRVQPGLRGQIAAEEFMNSRRPTGRGNDRPGAVGYAPGISIIPEGTTATARAVVSPDRRYVRMAINPQFSRITDVFTFSFINNGNSGGGNQTGTRPTP